MRLCPIAEPAESQSINREAHVLHTAAAGLSPALAPVEVLPAAAGVSGAAVCAGVPATLTPEPGPAGVVVVELGCLVLATGAVGVVVVVLGCWVAVTGAGEVVVVVLGCWVTVTGAGEVVVVVLGCWVTVTGAGEMVVVVLGCCVTVTGAGEVAGLVETIPLVLTDGEPPGILVPPLLMGLV